MLQLDARILDEGQETGALVLVMQIERAVAQRRLARDVLRTGGVIAALDEELARGEFDLGQAFGLAPCRARLLGDGYRVHRLTFLWGGYRSQTGLVKMAPRAQGGTACARSLSRLRRFWRWADRPLRGGGGGGGYGGNMGMMPSA